MNRKSIYLIFTITLFSTLVFNLTGFAQSNSIDAGLRIGSSRAVIGSAITARYYTDNYTSIQAIIGFSGQGGMGAMLEKHVDLDFEPAKLRAFGGAGAYIGFGERDVIGAQGVAGLEYYLDEYPVSVSFDWKPELNIISRVKFRAGVIGLTFRYRLNWQTGQ